MQSYRGFAYVATAIGGGAPVLGPADGPTRASIYGNVQQPAMTIRGTVAPGSAVPVQLTTTPQGPAWVVTDGRMRGAIIPYHHAAWSVNPPGLRR